MADDNWDLDLHREVIAKMEELENALFASEEADGEWPEEVETPSGFPYCGCEDCRTREILTIAMPRIVEAYQQGLIEVPVKPDP